MLACADVVSADYGDLFVVLVVAAVVEISSSYVSFQS